MVWRGDVPLLDATLKDEGSKFFHAIQRDEYIQRLLDKCHIMDDVIDLEQYAVLKWMISNGFYMTDWLAEKIIEKGNLDMIQWMYQHWKCIAECMQGCMRAARYGHLPVLQWLRANGHEWDHWTCAEAAFNGHVHILEWMEKNNGPFTYHTKEMGIRGGHPDVLAWLDKYENGL